MSNEPHPTRLTDTRLARFAPVAEPGPLDTPCIVVTRGRNAKGYGVANIDGRRTLAHRAAWEAEHGPIPPGMLVLHECDTPACIAISHLHLGSAALNASSAPTWTP